VLIGAPGSPAYEAALASQSGRSTTGFLVLYGQDLGLDAESPWGEVVFTLLLPALGAGYCGVSVAGAVQMQKLTSWDWARTACLLAMLPVHAGGVMLVTALCLQFLLKSLGLDGAYTGLLMAAVMVLTWLASFAVAARAHATLQRPEVIAGFTYHAE
jgi:hypothetical protein